MRKARKVKVFLGYRVLWLLMSSKRRWSIHEVAAEVGCEPNTAYRHLRELWSLDFIHIAGWARTYRHWMPQYRWGDDDDVPRPEPLTSQQVAQRKKAKDPMIRALKCVYMANYSRGTSWREALREDVASG